MLEWATLQAEEPPHRRRLALKPAFFLADSDPRWGSVLDLPAAWRLVGQEPLIVPVDDQRNATRAMPWPGRKP